jgi:N-acetylglucosamine kinase-like BadF-type ATPase
VAFYLGIDGGATKTSCAVGDESSVLGSGTAGASNLLRVDEKQARGALATAVAQACATANINPQQITATCVGVAGAARAEVSERIRRIVAEIVPGRVEIVGDMMIALQAAFGDGPGVVVIAGTGSIAYGRNHQGEVGRAGGWGFATSDAGSGYWIGRSAVSAVMQAHDEDESTALTGVIMNGFDARSWDELVLAVNAMPSPDFANLLPAVLSAADHGDVIARDVLSKAGDALANLGEVVIRRRFSGSAAVPVAMAGGVFRNSALVRQVFYNELRSRYPAAAVNATVIDPVRGALELARVAGRQVDHG